MNDLVNYNYIDGNNFLTSNFDPDSSLTLSSTN
jgi:hypothetical protein